MTITSFFSYLTFLLLCIGIYIMEGLIGNVSLVDICFVLFMLSWLSKKTLKFSDPFSWIILYFSYNIVLTSIIIVFLNALKLNSYFYIIREIIYLSIFFIVIDSYEKNNRMTLNTLRYIIGITTIYGLSQILQGIVSYYGISSLATKSPSQAGIIYLSAVILSTVLFLKYKGKINAAMLLLNILNVIATGSRTAILGLSVFLAVIVVLLTLNFITSGKVTSSIVRKIAIMSLLLTIIIWVLPKIDTLWNFFQITSSRFSHLSSSIGIRRNMSSNYFSEITGDSSVRLLFGSGKSIPELYSGSSTLAVDNQYTRFVIENGIIGFSLWISMILGIFKKFSNFHNPASLKYVLIGLIASFTAMGFGYEVFQVSRSASIFWFVFGNIYSIDKLQEEI